MGVSKRFTPQYTQVSRVGNIGDVLFLSSMMKTTCYTIFNFYLGILTRKNESDLADMKQQNYQLIRLVLSFV